MFHSHKNDHVDPVTGNTHASNPNSATANLNPTDHRTGLNSGSNTTGAGYGQVTGQGINSGNPHSTTAGAALDPTDHRTGLNSGSNTTGAGYGQVTGQGINSGNPHSTTAGAALDPTDHRTGINSGNTGGHHHSTTTGAALDPSDHRTGINSGGAANNTGFGTAGGLGHNSGNVGPGPHHTANADVPVGHRDDMSHGVTGSNIHSTTATGTHNTTGSHNTHGTTGAAGTDTGKAPSATVGKIEVAVGKVLHSASLQQKGEIKIEQATAHKAQGAELSEAERLEHEASLRRDRADQHGAIAAGGHHGHGHDNTAGRHEGLHGQAGLVQPGVAGPGGPVGLDGGFGNTTRNTVM